MGVGAVPLNTLINARLETVPPLHDRKGARVASLIPLIRSIWSTIVHELMEKHDEWKNLLTCPVYLQKSKIDTNNTSKPGLRCLSFSCDFRGQSIFSLAHPEDCANDVVRRVSGVVQSLHASTRRAAIAGDASLQDFQHDSRVRLITYLTKKKFFSL